MTTEATVESRTGAPRTSHVIAVLVVAAFVALLNETLLTVALPTLTREFAVGVTTAQWVTSGFLLTMAVVVPTTGFVLARFTPRRVFLSAVALFATGTAIAGTAPVFALLLAGRVLQAGGTAILVPLLMTTIMRLVPADRRGAAMGTVSLVIAAAPAAGPTVGGLLLDRWGWRALFATVLLLALIVLTVGAVALHVPTQTRRIPLDVVSVALSTVAFASIVHGFAALGDDGGVISGATVPAWVLLVAGALALAVFSARQVRLQRRDRALLDLRPFTYAQFTLTVAVAALMFVSLLGVASVLLPLYLQLGVGATPAEAGLAVLPGGLLLAVLGRPVGRFYDRRGPRLLLPSGAILLTAAVWAFALVPTPALGVAIALHVVLAVGIGLMSTPLLTSALAVLPAVLHSYGSAIMTTLQQVAGAAATAGFVAVASASSTGTRAGAVLVPDADGLRVSFLVVGCLGLLTVALTFFVTGERVSDQVTVSEHAEQPVSRGGTRAAPPTR